MAEGKHNSGRLVTVNPGKYRQILGIPSESPTVLNGGSKFQNLPPLVLEGICSKMNPNQIVRFFIYLEPIFDNVARSALQRACARADCEHVRIFLHWNSKKFGRVFNYLLGAFVRKVTLIGSGGGTDIERVRAILQKCPNIHSLRLVSFSNYRINGDYFLTMPYLTSIDLISAAIPITIRKFAQIVEFRATVSVGSCLVCKIAGSIKSQWFLDFLKANQQLLILRLKYFDCRECMEEKMEFVNAIQYIQRDFFFKDEIERSFLVEPF